MTERPRRVSERPTTQLNLVVPRRVAHLLKAFKAVRDTPQWRILTTAMDALLATVTPEERRAIESVAATLAAQPPRRRRRAP